MTMHPSRMMPGPHAVELQDAAGETVAMLWTHDGGVEVICERGYTADLELVADSPFRLKVNVTRAAAALDPDARAPVVRLALDGFVIGVERGTHQEKRRNSPRRIGDVARFLFG